jgi:hypothetical protein
MLDSWDTEQYLSIDLLHKDDSMVRKNHIQLLGKDIDNTVLNQMPLSSKELKMYTTDYEACNIQIHQLTDLMIFLHQSHRMDIQDTVYPFLMDLWHKDGNTAGNNYIQLQCKDI